MAGQSTLRYKHLLMSHPNLHDRQSVPHAFSQELSFPVPSMFVRVHSCEHPGLFHSSYPHFMYSLIARARTPRSQRMLATSSGRDQPNRLERCVDFFRKVSFTFQLGNFGRSPAPPSLSTVVVELNVCTPITVVQPPLQRLKFKPTNRVK